VTGCPYFLSPPAGISALISSPTLNSSTSNQHLAIDFCSMKQAMLVKARAGRGKGRPPLIKLVTPTATHPSTNSKCLSVSPGGIPLFALYGFSKIAV
jgi:hypothetical protein